jgi:hypothetical protein
MTRLLVVQRGSRSRKTAAAGFTKLRLFLHLFSAISARIHFILSFLQFGYVSILVPKGSDALVVLYDIHLDVAAEVRQLRRHVVRSMFVLPVLEAGSLSRF